MKKFIKNLIQSWLFPDLIVIEECKRLVELLQERTGSEYTTLELAVRKYRHKDGTTWISVAWTAYDELDHLGRSKECASPAEAIDELDFKDKSRRAEGMLQRALNPQTA